VVETERRVYPTLTTKTDEKRVINQSRFLRTKTRHATNKSNERTAVTPYTTERPTFLSPAAEQPDNKNNVIKMHTKNRFTRLPSFPKYFEKRVKSAKKPPFPSFWYGDKRKKIAIIII
jgi:hypothetical protein